MKKEEKAEEKEEASTSERHLGILLHKKKNVISTAEENADLKGS